MRTKFLLIIACFVFVSVAVSSCLDSDTEYNFSSDATVHAFGLDTIHGKSYKFEIDQIQRLIFNRDSLPMDADTIIDSILIDTFSVYGYIVSGTPDTMLNISNAQNLLPAASGNGMTFRVYAPDNLTSRTYTLRINIHKEDPDSMSWVKMASAPVVESAPQGLKAVALDDNLLVYFSNAEVYAISTVPGNAGNGRYYSANLPEDALLSSIINADGTLVANTLQGDVYTSKDGMQWERSETLSGNIVQMLAFFPANETSATPAMLSAIQEEADGKRYFCSTDASATGWARGDEVPEDFPLQNISAALKKTSNGLNQIFLIGGSEAESEHIAPWASMDGLSWVSLYTENGYCPALSTPYIIGYNEGLYILGGDMTRAYTSHSGGIVWTEADDKFWFPEEFALNGSSYTVALDRNDYIWVIWGGNGTNEIWRGCLNKLKKF